LWLAGLTAVTAYLAIGPKAVPLGLIAVPAICFVAALVWHERLVARLGTARAAVTFYETACARIEDRWQGAGNDSGGRFLDPHHPYAADLDLFGDGSLFELLNGARTAAGEAMLAGWLRSPAAASVARERLEAVRELAPRLDLREDLAIEGSRVRAELESAALDAWGRRPPTGFFPGALVALAIVSAGVILSFAAWFAGYVPLTPFWLSALAAIVLQGLLRDPVREAVQSLESRVRDLGVLEHLLRRVKQESFAAPRLVALRQEMGEEAASAIEQLRRWMELDGGARNQFFALVAFLVLWRPLIALAVEAWRARYGARIAAWIEAIAEFEALESFAAFAYEHPEAVDPELVESGLICEALAITHPLIPAARAVANDVRLGEDQRLLIISGSNMSGKSTLLRALGVNTVLAWAGAPVLAGRFRQSRVSLGCSIRTQDSVREGRSRFFAEITRLKQVRDLAPPVLFLLDELLSGTNSTDRRIGAEALLRDLLIRGGIGITTTHDTALVEMARTLPAAVNFHFADQYVDGALSFDYRMRPGPVERSNALDLMRSIGLEV
jgi:hypothetical protein